MGEVLSNGTFDAGIGGWSKSSASRTALAWDATGAAHDGGSAKAGHSGSAGTTELFGSKTAFTVSGSDSLASATMNAWVQYNDGSGTTTGKGCTIVFRVQLQDPDGNFYGVKNQTYTYNDSLHNLNFLVNEDVSSYIETGGDGTWYLSITNDITWGSGYGGSFLVGWWDDLSLDIAYDYSDTAEETITLTESTDDDLSLVDTGSETITLTESTSDSMVIEDSASDTITVTDNTADIAVISLATDFAYYFGSFDGKLYVEGNTYKSDAGTAIETYWESKVTDFADEIQQCLGRDKTLYYVDLWYRDISTSATITVSVSIDYGVTWTAVTRSIGSNDDKNKWARYFFHLTGDTFKFRVTNHTDSDAFHFIALEPNFALLGEVFEI